MTCHWYVAKLYQSLGKKLSQKEVEFWYREYFRQLVTEPQNGLKQLW